MREAVSTIESWGTPSIIATDVRPAPEFIQKLSSYFNVRLFVPRNSFREDFKRLLLKKEEAKANRKLAKNNHERDALSAAVMAWRENQNLIRSALAAKMENKERFAHLLLQGYRQDAAMLELNPPREEEKGTQEESLPRRQTQRAIPPSQILAEGRKISELQKRVQSLEQENEGLLHKISSYERGVEERLMRDNAVRKLLLKISGLESRLRHAQNRQLQPHAQSPQNQNWHGSQLQGTKNPKPRHTGEQKAGRQTHDSQPRQNQAQNSHAPKNESTQPPQKNAPRKTEPRSEKESPEQEKSAKISQQNLKGLNSLDTLARLVNDYRKSRKNP
jgi:predicted RNase H-like nuclease (RuvC/YqgF family)